MGCDNYIEMLVHPVLKKIAIRPAAKDNRNKIQWASGTNTNRSSRCFACMAYIKTLYQIFGWDPDFKYKLYGVIYHDGSDSACVFSDINASVYIDKDQYLSAEGVDASGQLLSQSGKHIRALAGDFENAVGKDYYVEMKGKKILIKGNHDKQYDMSLFEEITDFKTISANGIYIAMMHYPMLSWPKSHHGSLQLHGHVHGRREDNEANRDAGILRYDVGVDANNYCPVSIHQITTFFGI